MAWILLAIVAATCWWVMRVIKSLIRLRKQALAAWTQLESQLQARQSLARELLQAADNNESRTADLRRTLESALPENEVRTRHQLEENLTAALSRFHADTATQQSPNRQDTRQIQTKIESANNRIAIAAEFYNTQALLFNTRLTTMSLSLPARLAGFHPLDLFSAL